MARIDKLIEFLKSNPTDNFLQHALALENINAGNEEEARKLFEGILNRDPTYIGSYYHLAKLLERAGETDLAVQWYKKGMEAARIAGENHAYNELQSAFEELVS